jgi:hypothetical protein
MADNNTSNGIGVGTTLFIVFLILKLTGNISWSWLWVTSPLWIPVALGIVILGVVSMLMGASGKFKK